MGRYYDALKGYLRQRQKPEPVECVLCHERPESSAYHVSGVGIVCSLCCYLSKHKADVDFRRA